MYKSTTESAGVLRLSDNAFIPADMGNTDYQAYQAWCAAGNEPEAASLPDPNAAIRTEIDAIERATGVVRVVREGLMTFAELEAERKAAAMTAAGMPVTGAQLLALNPGYVRTRAVDEQITHLRGMLT